MADKHTPGPWIADDGDGNYYGVFADNGEPLAYLIEPGPFQGGTSTRARLLPHETTTQYFSGEDEGSVRWAEHVANANMMAAAPELRDALVKMERLCRELFGDGDDIDSRYRDECIKDMAEARALLARMGGAELSSAVDSTPQVRSPKMSFLDGDNSRRRPLSDLPWGDYPRRVARRQRVRCEVCHRHIEAGQEYRDGGKTRRAHESCLVSYGFSNQRAGS